MTEPITYNDLATFFQANYGTHCEILPGAEPTFGSDLLQCSTGKEDLPTFTVFYNGLDNYADLSCYDFSLESSRNVITCRSKNDSFGQSFTIAIEKFQDGALRAVGGLINGDSYDHCNDRPSSIYGRVGDLLDYLGSVYLGWYWVGQNGNWYTQENGSWHDL